MAPPPAALQGGSLLWAAWATLIPPAPTSWGLVHAEHLALPAPVLSGGQSQSAEPGPLLPWTLKARQVGRA